MLTPLGKRLRAIREERHLSMNAAAKLLNLTVSFVRDIECGNRGVSLDVGKKLTDVFDIPEEVIWYSRAMLPPDALTSDADDATIVAAYDAFRRVLAGVDLCVPVQ